jgi:hypothetical protein
MCDYKNYDGYNLGEGMRFKFQRHGHRPDISISATHHSLREAISHEVVVHDEIGIPQPWSENKSSEPPKYLNDDKKPQRWSG